MKRLIAAICLAAFTSIGAASAAQPGQEAVGGWIYDTAGAPIGSLRAIEGNEAIVMLGNYTWPGSHLVRVPAAMLAETGGRVTVSDQSELALRSLPPYRG